MGRKRSYLLVGLAMVACGVAPAELITLQSGQEINGRIISESDTTLTLSRRGQMLPISKSNIANINREDTSYYEQEFQQYLQEERYDRATDLIRDMQFSPIEIVREKSKELSDRLEAAQLGELDTPMEELSALPLKTLYDRFNDSYDKLKWEDVVVYGRAIIQRDTPSIWFFGHFLEGLRKTDRVSSVLAADAFRLTVHTETSSVNVSRVYLVNEINNRMLRLWDGEEPSRTDAEIYALGLVRGILFNLEKIREAGEEDRQAINKAFADILSSDDYDFATRRVSDEYSLLVFSNTARARPELLPVFRYFAILREEVILRTRTESPLVADALTEARGIYIYTISGITPLPKEKLWGSARDLAMFSLERSPSVSEVLDQVFLYSPPKQHGDISMAYEDVLLPEAMENPERTDGLGNAVKLIVQRRLGSDFDKDLTWEALTAYAILQKGILKQGQPVEVQMSDVLNGLFDLGNQFESQRAVIVFEPQILEAINRGERGDGLFRAIEFVAQKRLDDTSEEDVKMRAFEALTLMKRWERGDSSKAPATTSEIVSTVFDIALPSQKLTLSLMLEDEIINEAFNRQPAYPAVRDALRLLAAHYGKSLTDPDAAWRTFTALAATESDMNVPNAESVPVHRALRAGFSATPQAQHPQIALVYEDSIHAAVLEMEEIPDTMERAVLWICVERLKQAEHDPLGTWRAFNIYANLNYGSGSTRADILTLLDSATKSSPALRLQGLEVITAFYREDAQNPLYKTYRDRWSSEIVASVEAWVDRTATDSGFSILPRRPSEALFFQVPFVQAAFIDLTNHTRLIQQVDEFEKRLQRKKSGYSADELRKITMELNSYVAQTPSEAVRKRIGDLVERHFIVREKRAMLDNGLRIYDQEIVVSPESVVTE